MKTYWLRELIIKAIRMETPIKPISNGVITSGFGIRKLGSRTENHPGIDISVYGDKTFVPVIAAKSGTISWIDRKASGSFGNVVYVKLPDGWFCVYPHLKSVNEDLFVGQKITQGHELGIMGNTGIVWARDEKGIWGIRKNPKNNDGIHLHYEERPTMAPGGAREPKDVIELYTKK